MLIAVLSHLHAVVEEVEDVMWVELRPEGSMARWLAAAERDDLAREDVPAACSPSYCGLTRKAATLRFRRAPATRSARDRKNPKHYV